MQDSLDRESTDASWADGEPSPSGSGERRPEDLGKAMEAYRRYLWMVANREIAPVLRPKGGASDLVQETFLEAHRDLDRFSGKSPRELKGWLRQILRNNVANFVRRYRASSKRRIALEVPMDGGSSSSPIRELLEASTVSPSGQAMQREDAARLEAALVRLRERERLVYTWRMEEYCEWKEIGRRLGGSDEKARKIFSRAVARLRAEVGDPAGPPHRSA